MLIKPQQYILDTTGKNLIMNNEIIEKVPNFKFLGIWLDENLKWDVHVNIVDSKLVQNRYALRKIMHLCNKETKKLLYYAYINSHLLYGLCAWGTIITESDKQLLVRKQNSILQMMRTNQNS